MSLIRLLFTFGLLLLAQTAPMLAKDLRLEDFFKGRTTATASFKTITGTTRNFTVKLNGKWDGKTLVLREDFFFDDGEKDTKTWRFTKTGWNTYIGTREDVIGETTVSVNGNKGYFNYLVDLDPGPRRNIVRFYDTLELGADGNSLKNTARVFKGPLQVARVRVDFKR